jgi:hypothetical protein
MKNKSSKRLEIKRETLRELNPRSLVFAQGGAISAAGSDVSNCCCQPTSNQSTCGDIKI